ncbi:MAG: arginine deiminase [Spirochaeta sp. LUC14_002_19_P3]|nr:MAG: arginine deiminase [Spirochaeta sp. LUC14_002_19_P3]
MAEQASLSVQSEIGPLRKVLLHRPGRELETLTPQFLEELLFDDIPWLERIQEEHDQFADTLRTRGCKVYYYTDLLADILRTDNVREELLNQVLTYSRIPDEQQRRIIRDYLNGKRAAELAEILIGGLRKEDVPRKDNEKRLSHYIRDGFPYCINPLPNLYFTRDPGTIIGTGIAINAMKTAARSRESLILNFIYRRHPLFAETRQLWYSPEDGDSIEGGDILVLSPRALAIGCSARTSSTGIEKLAARLFVNNSGIQEILVLHIPNARAFMHLDTVFTMLDFDKFIIYPGIEHSIQVFHLSPSSKKGVHIQARESLADALKSVLKLPALNLVPSGGGDYFTAAREQWNDSANTLALAPGIVITYKRNFHSNETLRRNGIEVVEIEGSELVRGRGGPRCMSMPLERESVGGFR